MLATLVARARAERATPYARRVTAWERRTEWPLAGAAVLFLVAYAWPVLDPTLDRRWMVACSVVTWVVYAGFLVDYLVRLRLAHDRGRWFVRHLLDLLILALPLLRPLRLLRLIALLQVLNRTTSGSLRGRVALYVSGGSVMLWFVAALAVLDAERDADGATITTLGDAVWWAAATMTTVGYGDRVPVTGTGRAVGIGLMVCGIALLGSVTAMLASWLLHFIEEEQEQTSRDLDVLTTEVRQLREAVEGLRTTAPSADP